MVTIKEVAKEAHVSLMTVSRVINTPELVKEDTIKKVNEVIERLGYRPNLLAKSLAKGKSKTIGILSSNMYNQAYIDIISSIEKAAYADDYVVIKADVNSLDSAKKALDMLLGSKVDGIIVTPLEMNITVAEDFKSALKETDDFMSYFYQTIKKENIKAVTVSQKYEDIINVEFDYKAQTNLTLNYLLGKGYKNISFINYRFKEGLWKTKEDEYRRIMKENNLENYIHVAYSETYVDGGKSAAIELLNKTIPEAIYCGNDLIACGVMQAIQEKGLSIPKDIAIIGNDDMYLCNYVYPKLTSIALGAKEAGDIVIKVLLDLINGRETKFSNPQPYLIERDSI